MSIKSLLRVSAHLCAVFLVAQPVLGEQCSSTCAPDGKQASGAVYRICMPPPGCYNGDLVIYAHGYVDAYQLVGIPEDQLTSPDGVSLPQLVNGLGYAFATTSYRRNGLAVLEGVEDTRDLVEIFRAKVGNPGRVYLVGPSQGGLITAKSIETYPGVYTGGLAACGPIGNFRAQINYIGDFRVVFDYFFPGVIPGSPTVVPQFVIDHWSTIYERRIKRAVRNNPDAAAQLIKVAKVSIGLSPTNIENAIVSLAWYAVFATNDARQQLGGQPFDNIGKWYFGSKNDVRLNLLVQRAAADPQAIAALQKYETSGLLGVPLLTLHTTGDQIIPYGHEPVYRNKVEAAGSGGRHTNIPILRYGHCEFKVGELLLGFGLLVLQTTGRQLPKTQWTGATVQ